MKKLLTIFIIAIGNIASAQTFVTENSSSGDSSIVNGDGTITVYNKIKATGSPVTIKWNVISYSTNLTAAGTQWGLDGICDNVLCYVGAPLFAGTVYTTDPYSSSGFGTFYVLLKSDNAAIGSTAWIQVKADDAAIGTSRTLTFIATKNTTGVSNFVVSDDKIHIYPNPAGKNIIVSIGEGNTVKTINVYSADGKQLISQKVSDKITTLSLDALTSGVYFISLKNADGHTISSKRILHN